MCLTKMTGNKKNMMPMMISSLENKTQDTAGDPGAKHIIKRYNLRLFVYGVIVDQERPLLKRTLMILRWTLLPDMWDIRMTCVHSTGGRVEVTLTVAVVSISLAWPACFFLWCLDRGNVWLPYHRFFYLVECTDLMGIDYWIQNNYGKVTKSFFPT